MCVALNYSLFHTVTLHMASVLKNLPTDFCFRLLLFYSHFYTKLLVDVFFEFPKFVDRYSGQIKVFPFSKGGNGLENMRTKVNSFNFSFGLCHFEAHCREEKIAETEVFFFICLSYSPKSPESASITTTTDVLTCALYICIVLLRVTARIHTYVNDKRRLFLASGTTFSLYLTRRICAVRVV